MTDVKQKRSPLRIDIDVIHKTILQSEEGCATIIRIVGTFLYLVTKP